MRYHVDYLSDGERETAHVEAPDAATAVAAAEAAQTQTEAAFELLLVTPEEGDE